MSQFSKISLSEATLRNNKRNAWYVASLVINQMKKFNASKNTINQFVYEMLAECDCEDIDRYLEICKKYVNIK